MQRNYVVVGAIILSFLLGGVIVPRFTASYDEPQQAAQQAPEQPSTPARAEASEKSEEQKVEEARAREEARQKEEEQAKEQRLREYKEAFGLIPQQKQAWNLHEPGGIYARVCAGINRWYTMRSALNEFEDKPLVPTGLRAYDLGNNISEGGMRLAFRQTTINLAKDFLAIMRRPYQEREAAGYCGLGEASFAYTPTERIMFKFNMVLDEAKLSPRDLGTTPQAIRATVLGDFRGYVKYLRGKSRGGTDPQVISTILWVSGYDADQLGFDPKEIGLTQEEIFQIHKR